MRSRLRGGPVVAGLLALAVGVVVGAGPLSSWAQSPSAPEDSTTAPASSFAAAGELTFADQFATSVAARVYADALAGHPVTVLTMPGADEAVVNRLVAQVRLGGGTITGLLRVRDSLLDPSQRTLVDTLGSQLATQQPAQLAGRVQAGAPTYVRIGQLLGVAVATARPAGRPAGAVAVAVRRSLAAARLVEPRGSLRQLAPLVLVVLGSDPTSASLPGLLNGLATGALGVVVAGTSEQLAPLRGPGTRPAAVRLDPDVTTVDGTDTVVGQITVVQALIHALTAPGGAFGGSGADGPVPLR